MSTEATNRIETLEEEVRDLKAANLAVNEQLGRALNKILTYKLRDARIATIRSAAKIFLEDFPGDL